MIMEKATEFMYLMFLFLMTKAPTVSGSFESNATAVQFAVSYLSKDIPEKDFKNATLGVEYAACQVSCSLSCLNKRRCVTSLFLIHKESCIMLDRFLKSTMKYGLSQEKKPRTKIIVLRAMDPCFQNLCKVGSTCAASESGFKCLCGHNQLGEYCERDISQKSCKHIQQTYPDRNMANGEYNITDGNGKNFTAYCDMQFDEGGWTQVLNVEKKQRQHLTYKAVSSFAEFSAAENYVATKQFLGEFKKLADFKQLRFECTLKMLGRKIHIKTKASTTSVVDYFAGKTDARPIACGSFETYKEDNSQLSKTCNEWGVVGNKWGTAAYTELGLADHTMYVQGKWHWILLYGKNRFLCDNNQPNDVSDGDFWRVYVR